MTLTNFARTRRSLVWLLALGFCLATPLHPAPWVTNLAAQQFTHNTTTTSAAQTATDTTLSLTSASAASGSTFGAVAVGQYILVDQEMELITALSSTTATVQRRGRPTAHASGTPVYIGPAGSFQSVDPAAGACTTANQPKWWINITSGAVFTCGANSVWARSNAPWFGAAASGNGATVTLTAGESGTTQVFDRAAGIVFTLPAPMPGMSFDFFVRTSITSNAAKVITNSASVFLQGSLINIDTDTTNAVAAWTADGTTIRSVSMNGTTTGGLLGTWMRFTAVSSTIWLVTGIDQGSGTVATPFATS